MKEKENLFVQRKLTWPTAKKGGVTKMGRV